MNRCVLAVSALAIVGAMFAPPSIAQWSSDPLNNLRVADRSGDQVQPKLAPSPDGGTYISWYDNGVANYKNDTWTWSGTAWTRSAAIGPAARYRNAMAYDAVRQRTVLFGGANATTSFADTWEWDGASWTQRVISGPAARSAHAMVFDAAHNTIVMFGGVDGSGTVDGDTWTFNGASWTQLSPPTSPTARQGHAMAYDSVRNVVVMFGGADGSGTALADTWEWNGTTWTPASPVFSPTARAGHAMSFDPVTSQIILFGGQVGGAAQQDTWLYNGVTWTSPLPTTLPTARFNCAMAQDFTAAGVRTVVFGGNSGTFNVGNLYEWSGINWASKTSSPSSRNGPALAFHAANNTTVLFGGLDLGGYDVYLQKVNAAGVEQWAHNGIAIADRAQSSTVDYSLACDQSGNAVIVFNDDRFSVGKITIQKVSPAGALLFGANGVQVGDGGTTSAPPTVAVLSDGNYGVIWNSAASPVTTNMQKVDSNTGALLWNGGAPLVQADWLTPARPVQASDCQPDNAGGMIVLFVRCTGTNCVTSAKQLATQRYNAIGQPVWNSGTPILLMTGTSGVQTGTFPRFIHDGNGGGVYGYYDIGTPRNAYIQHVLPGGTLKFASPIANTGPTAPTTRIRVGAGLAYDAASGSYYLASPETDASTQAQNSTFVQKFDSTGARLWGDTGITIVPTSNAAQQSFVQAQAIGGDVLVFFMDTRSAVTRVISAARVNQNNDSPALAWYNQVNTDSSTDKSRLTSAMSTCGGFPILSYGWTVAGSSDIAVQNVQLDGSIGPGGCAMFTTQPPASAHPCQGSTLNLTAAASGASEPCLQWRKNGVALGNGGRISGANSNSLTIANIQTSDAGSYDVVATNTCGSQPSNAAAVTICAADYNCDNTLSVGDIFDFLAAWFAGNPNTDFNRNGTVNVTDIFDFLAAWFAGC